VLSAGAAVSVTATAFPGAGPASGWALGTSGGQTLIWHTSDAGASWQVQWRGSGVPLAISAVSPARAWALAGCASRSRCGRQLLGTSDGGRHWRMLTTWPSSVPVSRVQFVTAGLGVAIADACLTSPALPRCPGELLVSHDGGARWSKALGGAAPVFATAARSGELWAAETFPGQSAGIRLLTSRDGGRSWQRLGQVTGTGPLTPDVRVTLALAGGKLAWASVFDQLSCAMHGCAVANLVSSANGGRTWSQVNLPDAYPDDCASDDVALSVAPGGAVWAATGRNGAACPPPLGLVYLRSGSGWREPPSWQIDAITSVSAVSANVAYAIGEQGALSRTENGGQSWAQVLPSPVPSGELAVPPASGASAFGAQNSNDAGAVLRSVSGGRAWQQVADLPGVVTQLGFTSVRAGFAVTYAVGGKPAWRLWTTASGGATWSARGLPSPPATSGFLDGPWLTADGHGLLLTVANGDPWQPGAGGTGPVREWTTTNGGVSWTQGATLPLGGDTLEGSPSFWYTAASGWSGWLPIANASFTTQIAAFSGGRLIVLPGKPPTDDVALTGPGAGFAWGVTYSGPASVLVLYRTSDNGRTWRHDQVKLPANDQATPLLSFGNLNDGWLVLGSSTYRTTDSGQSWHIG